MNTENWIPSTEHPGYVVKTLTKGNCTIQVFRPELSDRERAKVEAQVKARAERVLRDYYIRKEENA